MMANWDLHPLVRDLRRLQPRLVLVAGANDSGVPPEQAPGSGHWCPPRRSKPSPASAIWPTRSART